MKTPSAILKLLILSVLFGIGSQALAQSTYWWLGQDIAPYWNYNNNWSTSEQGSPTGNALNGSAKAYLNFGTMYNNGTAYLGNTNNAYNAGFQIYFKNDAPGAYNLNGNGIGFYDYNSVDPNIQNEGTTYTPVINFAITNYNLNGAYRILNVDLNSSPGQGPITFNGPITSWADGNARVINVNVGSGNAITFNGQISDGSGSVAGSTLGLSQLGSGITILNATNTYTGQTTVNAGTLVVNTNSALGAGLLLMGGGSLSNNASCTEPNAISLSSATMVGVASGTTLTLSGVVTNTGALTKAGAGTLTLAARNAYSGGTTVSAGTLKAGSTNCFGPNNGAITINSGGTLDVNGNALGGNNGTSNYNVTVSGAGVGGNGAIISSSGSQTKALSSVSLNADTTIGGTGPAWGLLGGGLQGNGHNLTAVGSSGIYFGNKVSTLTNLQNININGGYICVQQTATVDNNSAGSIYLNSGGTLRLGLYGTAAANLNILKPIVMAGGVLGTDNTGANGNSTVAAGITLNATGIFAPQSTSTLTLNGPIVNGSANAVTFNAAISGAGTNVLMATNTFTGPIITNIGTVMISGAGQLGSGAYAGNITNGGSFIYNSSAAQTLSGVISGAGSFADSGTGTLILSGANSYAGGTTISAGILEADNNSALGTGLLTMSGGTLSNNVGSTLSNPVNLSGNATVGVGALQTLTLSGTITNTGGLTKSGAGTNVLTAQNTYTGATTVNGGTLALTGSGALATNSAITINGGTLDMGSQNATNFTGNNGISFGANGGNLNGTSTDYMFGTSGSYTAFTVAANASAIVNENLNITNLANSSYFNLVNAGSGAMLTINGVLTALNNPSGIFLTGGGALTLNNTANNFNTIIYNSGTLITTNFATLGSYPYLAQMGQGVANGPCTFNYGGPGVSTTRSVIGNAAIINVNNNGSGLVTLTASPFNLRYGSAQTGSGQQLAFGGTSDMALTGVLQDNTPGTYSTAVVKTNANTLTLYGNSTYSGATTIKGGFLIGVTAGSCSNSAVTLAAITGNSAVLGVTVTNITKQWTISSLTVNNGGVSSSLQFNFGSLTPGTTAAPLNVTGALTFTTTPAIVITGSSLPASTGNGYPLMTWGSGGPASTNGMTLSLPFRAGGSLAIVGNTLYLQSSGSTEPLSWTGGNSTWDVNNIANNTIWKDNTSASTYYVDGDSVVFNNTVGSGGVVTNNTTVSPASVTVMNPTADYTISGSGGIAGSAALTKSGAGTLTLSTVNTYSGATAVNGGTLALSGSGALATNSAITINGGTLDLGSQNAANFTGNNNGISFGANGGNLNGSGTNTIVGLNSGATALQVAANGAAVVNENIIATNMANYANPALASVGSGASLTINGQVIAPGYTLWLQGGGTLTLNNTRPRFSYMNIWATGGTVVVTNFSAVPGAAMVLGQSTGNGPATFCYAGPTATSSLFFESGELSPTILNTGSGILTFNASTFTVPYGAPVSATPQTLTLGGSGNITITGNIQNANTTPGSFTTLLVKTNADTLTLSGVNTYSGTTTVSGGTLLVNGSIGTNTVTVASGAKLGGTGTIGGSVTLISGALMLFTNGGTLTISGALTASANVAHLNLSNNVPAGIYLLATYAGGSVSFASAPVIDNGGSFAAGTTNYITTGGGQVNLVVQNTTTTGLATSGSPSTYGQSVTLTATVSPAPATVGETITFYDGATAIGTGTNNAGGVALLATSALVAGAHSLTAIYPGDSLNLGSTSSPWSQTVNTAPLGVTANNTNKVYNSLAFYGGNGVTYSGFVNSETAGVLGGTLIYGGTAQGATSAGTYTIAPSGLTATNYAISYTNGTLTISQAGTFVGASSSENPSGYKDSISFQATLPSDATGSVVFSSTNGPISTNSVSSGTATSLSITNLPRGTNVITVAYLGDGNYLGSTNSTLLQVVTNHPPTATVLTVTCTEGLSVKVALSNLATNWSDVDGDTVELTAINLTTTNGQTLYPLNLTTNLDGSYVVGTNAYIGYVNPTNVLNDQFSYSMSDGQGGTNIGYVNIVISTNVITGQATGVIATGGGPVTVNFAGIIGYSYGVQRSTNLLDWVTLWTTNAPAGGLFNFTDSFGDLGGVPSSAYYRLSWEP